MRDYEARQPKCEVVRICVELMDDVLVACGYTANR